MLTIKHKLVYEDSEGMQDLQYCTERITDVCKISTCLAILSLLSKIMNIKLLTLPLPTQEQVTVSNALILNTITVLQALYMPNMQHSKILNWKDKQIITKTERLPQDSLI
jgi:hypothetical protein